jgi:hypothetical protein
MAKQGGPIDINMFIFVLLLTVSISISILTLISISISISAMMHNMSVFNSMWSCAVSTVVYLWAPAGGAAAAAPEGVALAGPSASPHLPVVGARNPVAVPGMAR